ncbi:MAG: FAD/NAD(P)-binding protein [Candidatus Marinimicrobia bacterium]|jgi:sulfite reductase subunit B|nr:FAD/NAD(P)-binding protein [Candidatus Neomarinimicrobiota bacterium]MBT3632735.1 FAD/NAD(P)-binding protein [Candidatus Neomarinimicrobiota bacterium]MBT3681845.1 FAD/NAD(P)-binding protein [Candidatus Neomarinimicrobiota bacterium]MBT3760522.1 FAD/NAD(P)-binding protein [Candidatus Neomarinimicrobiota bacterium]MBT3896668.1 FAD/NAD(P)-binding protein [Candidatus Neomarinimicrobiota bacterium]
MIKTVNIKPENFKELYFPTLAEITEVQQFTEKEKWYKLSLLDGSNLGHYPGQFVEVSIFGAGEAPISITSAPNSYGSFELCIREVGMFTEMIHKMKAGDKLGIRGPFGQGFDVNELYGKDILIIGGGIGIVPLRSLINYILDHRQDYGRLIITYGARNSKDLLFPEELELWQSNPDVEFHQTVDYGDESWKGNVGVITTLIPPLDLDLKNTIACITGPPIMYKFVLLTLQSKGLQDDNIYMSLERRMKCGVGKCGHCQINHSYVCQDGPVYHYPDLKLIREAI